MSSEQVSIANVTFEPDCRNHWHIHHGGGQILLCTAGNGYYQEWGKDIVELHAGDVVNIPAEVKHWHGATKNSWFSHIAISVPCENGYCEWLEEVEKEKFDTCKHAKRTGNFAVHVKPTCKQATMIRGRLVVSKARCLKCELLEPKKTRRKKDADQKSE